MKQISVRLKEYPYSIYIGKGVLSKASDFVKDVFPKNKPVIITNRKVWNLWRKYIDKAFLGLDYEVIFVKDGEGAKSFEYYRRVIEKIIEIDKEMRSVVVFAVGGGVVGDLAGFVSATYRRGVPIVQVPTTLLSQIDSSIGGKTAINSARGKNLIGAYYQPALVVSDVNFLSTLKPAQIREGISEGIKYGVIKDKELFEYLEAVESEDAVNWAYFVERCASIKARVVEKDEKEKKGIRFILNFGHTIGHAIENSCGYSVYSHGQSVAIGMAAACDLSVDLGLLSERSADRIERLILKFDLPVKYKGCGFSNLWKALLRDKKFHQGKNRFVLPRRIGKVEVVENVPFDLIKKALKERSYG